LEEQRGRGGYDHDTLTALIASARQAVSDTAQAPRRMAERSYGTGERCTADIALQRLETCGVPGSACHASAGKPADTTDTDDQRHRMTMHATGHRHTARRPSCVSH
jgi:hypothetical protein